MKMKGRSEPGGGAATTAGHRRETGLVNNLESDAKKPYDFNGETSGKCVPPAHHQSRSRRIPPNLPRKSLSRRSPLGRSRMVRSCRWAPAISIATLSRLAPFYGVSTGGFSFCAARKSRCRPALDGSLADQRASRRAECIHGKRFRPQSPARKPDRYGRQLGLGHHLR